MWTIIDEVGDVVTGATPPKDIKDYYGGNIPFYKPNDLSQGINTLTATDHLSVLGFNQSRKLPANSILVTCIGATIGKTGRILKEGTCNQQINAVITNKATYSLFLYYVLTSDFFQTLIKINASATTLPILNKSNLAKLSFPLPPLPEQQRIVTEIERWFKLIDAIEQGKADLQAAIKQAKSKILDLAIHVKLVPQDPNDEPASELLRRINPKVKITCDNEHSEKLPFEIPKGWVWCQVSDVFELNPKNDISDSTPSGFIPMASVEDGFGFSHTFETRQWGTIKRGYSHFQNGDIGIAKISPCFENRKSTIFYDLPNGVGAGTTELTILRGYSVHNKFYLYFFQSDWYIFEGTKEFKGVVGQQRVNREIFTTLLIPLPPFSEQQRIVAKIEELFSTLDNIQAALEV